jgi:hypothetical protein
MFPYRKALCLRIAPQEEFALCNWVPGGGQRRSGENSSEDSPDAVRGEQGSGQGPTRVRFVGLAEEEELQAGGRTGGRRRSPLEPLLRRASGRGKATGDGGSPQVVYGRCRRCWPVKQLREEWSSMATVMADRGGLGGVRAGSVFARTAQAAI